MLLCVYGYIINTPNRVLNAHGTKEDGNDTIVSNIFANRQHIERLHFNL